MSEKIRVMYSEEEVNSKIVELGERISADLNGEPVKKICILKGASFFTCALAKRITVAVSMKRGKRNYCTQIRISVHSGRTMKKVQDWDCCYARNLL